MLKRIILFLMLATAVCAFAETDGLPSPRNKTYHGYYYFRTEQGDSALMLVINNITVFPPERFKNKNQEQFYWRTVRDVRKGLPYAKLISATVIETYEYIETLPTTKEREAYLKSMERDVFNQYKPELKRFSRQQARVLVKLINRFDVKLFFELDIDSVVGLAEVERLRHKLERMTGKKPIPVWHKNRGKEYFVKMCEEYPYVAIGGIVTKEIPRKVYETAFPWFINTAHKHKAKIHGLGYTTVANLQKYRFDSVDSTAWLYGNRGGYICKFNPRTGLMEQMSKEGCRLKSREGAVNNFNEWVKLSRYAEKFL